MKKSVKLIVIFFSLLFIFLILNSNVYAANNYTNLPIKNINGKEVIYGIDLNNNTVEQVITSKNFNLSYEIKAFRNNIKLGNKDKVSTNTIIKIYNNGNVVKQYYVLIYGDVTGNGIVNSTDALAIIKNKLNKVKIEDDICLEAARVLEKTRTNKNIPSSSDALAIVHSKLGKYTIIQGIQNTSKPNPTPTPTPTSKPNPTPTPIPTQKPNQDNTTPVGLHGKLSVVGTNIVDKNMNKFQLKGVSTHGIAWFPQYVNEDGFKTMRDEWGINAVRLAMYSDPNAGYTKAQHEKVKQGVNYATNLGLYVIIDWHILGDGNPNMYKSQALEFFTEMASLYKDNINVIYEICNEPNGDVQWDRDIKPYAEEVIARIRSIDNDAIIICGTPTWSQDVDVVANNPIKGYNNITYALHFYAATHKQYLRDKLQVALNSGLPIFVSEFGICDASGNGWIDENEANIWIDYLNRNNISWMCWNLSNKNESSSLLSPNTSKVSNWNIDDLSQSGKWLINAIKR